MYNFTTETQGLDTFRICEVLTGTQIDTAGLGMLLNNKIGGLCPVSSIQMDNRSFIRYNISSQISLQQFFMYKVDKKKFLTVLNNILTAIENLEDYMLDPGMLLLEKEEIYVNVGTLQTDLIYYPILEDRKPFDVSTFVKHLIMDTEFDPNERDNYVTLLISYLNCGDHLSVTEIKEYIAALLKGTNTKQSYEAQTAAMPSLQESAFPAPQPMPQQEIFQMPYGGIPEQEISNINMQPQQNPMPSSNHMGFAIPGSSAEQEPDKKKGLLVKLGLKSQKEKTKQEKVKPEKIKQEKVKKEKPAKAEKKKKEIATPSGMVIPNMDNTKSSTLPQPPRPEGAPSLHQPMMQQPSVQPEMQPMQQPVVQPVMHQPVMQQPVVQPIMQQPVIQRSPIQSSVPQSYAASSNFGETVVLGTDTSGETTVLSAGYNTMQKQRNPYLIRRKTNERVEINKDVFRIGKERSYVDYCIMDNSAVSRSHADIMRKNNEFYIVDNNSLNHTFLNGAQIPSSQMQKLEDYMVIKLADEIFEFRL